MRYLFITFNYIYYYEYDNEIENLLPTCWEFIEIGSIKNTDKLKENEFCLYKIILAAK